MATKRHPLAKRLAIIASVSWSNHDDITKGLGPVARGTVTFGHFNTTDSKFENHFRSLNLTNYHNHRSWFEEFWEIRFECSFGNSSGNSKKCMGEEDLRIQQMEIAPVRVVINAVYAMEMQKALCPNAKDMCDRMKPLSRTLLRKFLESITFPDSSFGWPIRFNQNNEVAGNYTMYNYRKSKHDVHSYIHVGNWTSKFESDIIWPDGKIASSVFCLGILLLFVMPLCS